jgi:hypothetical protein
MHLIPTATRSQRCLKPSLELLRNNPWAQLVNPVQAAAKLRLVLVRRLRPKRV